MQNWTLIYKFLNSCRWLRKPKYTTVQFCSPWFSFLILLSNMAHSVPSPKSISFIRGDTRYVLCRKIKMHSNVRFMEGMRLSREGRWWRVKKNGKMPWWRGGMRCWRRATSGVTWHANEHTCFPPIIRDNNQSHYKTRRYRALFRMNTPRPRFDVGSQRPWCNCKLGRPWSHQRKSSTDRNSTSAKRLLENT